MRKLSSPRHPGVMRHGQNIVMRRSGLASFSRPYLVPLSTSTLLTIVGAALDLARPWPLKLAVDGAIGHKPLTGPFEPLNGLSAPTLAAVAAASAFGLVIAGGAVDYLAEFTIGSTAERIGADLRAALFARLARLSLRFHDRNRTGDLVNRLTSDVSRVQEALVAQFETLLPNALTLTGMIVVVFAVDAKLAVVALGVVPVLAVAVTFMRRRLKRAQRVTRSLYGALATQATDVLRNVRVVQAFAREQHEEERFKGESDAMMRAAVRAAKVEAWYAPANDAVLAFGGALVLWLGVVQVTRGQITLGTLLVVLSYVSGIYRPIRSLARLASTLAKGAVSRERLTEIFECDEDVPEARDAVTASVGDSRLVLHDVSFGYDKQHAVLRRVSLEIAPGETICVVGPSGAGKSTLLALLLRLYDPDKGTIELAGIDLRQIALRSLRERIAFVPQDPWMLDGTIAGNIAFGRTDATPEEIRWAAHLSRVDEFAERLRERYETNVGEGGVLLSGGQRRRIALARALVRGASILLLDEPTTGLDSVSEAEVLAALRRVSRGRTVIIAAHALSIAALSDRIIVLDRGRVTEQGSHDELLSGRVAGKYARLWELQQGVRPVTPLRRTKGGELDDTDQRPAEDPPRQAEARRRLTHLDGHEPVVVQY